MMWDGWGWMMMGPFMMLLFFGVIIVLAVMVIRWLSGSGQNASLRKGGNAISALDILNERLANGEIDKDEYLERRRLLED